MTSVPRLGPRTYGDCTRILSIDGGGVRGLVPALILAEIERRTGRPIYQQFDLIVGTSTGSILALGLTRPSNADAHKPAYSAQDLVQLYRDHAQHIFPSSFAPLRYLRRIFRPKFSPHDVESVYETYFEDVRLIEALTNVAIPAYDIENSRRLWFLSYTSSQGNLLMRDLVRGATAAPTYFAPARLSLRGPMSPTGRPSSTARCSPIIRRRTRSCSARSFATRRARAHCYSPSAPAGQRASTRSSRRGAGASWVGWTRCSRSHFRIPPSTRS